MSSAALKRLSWEQYVEYERDAPEKSEFYDGELFAMAGGSANHCLVATNFTREAGNALKSRNCRVYGSDMRVLCPTGLGTYPDASIVCSEPHYRGDGQDTLVNPVVLVEVLSPTTEAYDRGKRFEHYQSLLSLQEYVLISQDHVRIEHFARQRASGQWLLMTFSDPDGQVELPVVGIALSVAEIYAKVAFAPPVPE
ncbi:MAG: Uma2 family endonuclease [Planctomycetaceae bacterium]|nr:Uma2 family endonuclease [Planctomycetaceae bacterium]